MDRRIPSNAAIGSPHGRSTKNEGISPTLVLHAARRWWKVAAPIAILFGAAGAAAVWLLFEMQYTASAIIRIETNRFYIAFPSPPSPPARFIETQRELLHSPMVLNPLLSQPEILQQKEIREAENPLAHIQKALKVNAVGESDLFRIEYTCSAAADATTMVNAAVESYLKYQSTFEGKRNDGVIALLEGELEKHRKNVERLRDNVRVLSEEANVVPSFLQQNQPAQNPAADPIAQIQASLTEAEVQEILLQADIQYAEAENALAVAIPDEVVNSRVDQELLEQRNRLEEQRRELETLADRFQDGSNNPIYRQYLSRVEQEEKALAKLRSEMKIRIGAELRSQLQTSRAIDIESLKSQLAREQATIKTLKGKLTAALGENTKSVGNQLELDFANRELQQAEDVYDVLQTRITQIKTERNAPTWITLESEAKIPLSPVKPLPFKEMFLVFLVASCIPFGLATGWEYLLKRVNATHEIEQIGGLTVVGEIVSLPRIGYSQRSQKRLAYGRHLFEESVDGLTTYLVLSQAHHDMRVLAIASAVSSEGKTSVATELAISIAKSTGRPTLLIDGDMRAPDVHRIFEVPLSPGLAEVLADESDLAAAVVGTDCQHLDLLPAGFLESSPHRLLNNDAFARVLEAAKANYRYIIVDTPPVLAASEALLLARQSDAVLLCAMRDRTRLGQLQGAHSRLASAGVNSIGVVMSGVPTHHYASRYGSYSYKNTTRHI